MADFTIHYEYIERNNAEIKLLTFTLVARLVVAAVALASIRAKVVDAISI